jgi:hypothetical protein
MTNVLVYDLFQCNVNTFFTILTIKQVIVFSVSSRNETIKVLRCQRSNQKPEIKGQAIQWQKKKIKKKKEKKKGRISM